MFSWNFASVLLLGICAWYCYLHTDSQRLKLKCFELQHACNSNANMLMFSSLVCMLTWDNEPKDAVGLRWSSMGM